MNFKRLHKTWPLITAIWLLAGCGGGSSENTATSAQPMPPTQWDQGSWDQITWQ